MARAADAAAMLPPGESRDGTLDAAQHLKRRQAIEPIIGHLKTDHRMDRCHLKGEQGDRLHAVLCAAGYNIRWLLRMIVKKGVSFLRPIFLCLQQASVLGLSWLVKAMVRVMQAQKTWSSARRCRGVHRRARAYASVAA